MLFWSPFLLRFDSDKWDSTQTWLRHLSKKMAGRASAWVSSWIKHRSLKKMINLQLHPTYWLTHIEMRRKMCYFVVFQPSKVEMLIFSASILINLTHFPRWLRKSARSLLYKLNKTQKIWAGWGLWAGDVSVIQSGRRYIGYAWEVKSQIDSHLSHRKTKHYITRWKVMCFCVIELKKAKLLNSTRYIFISSMDIRHSPCPE